VDTGFIKKHEAELLSAAPVEPPILALAAVAYAHSAAQRARQGPAYVAPLAPWGTGAGAFRVNHDFNCPVRFSHPQVLFECLSFLHPQSLSCFCFEGQEENAPAPCLGPAYHWPAERRLKPHRASLRPTAGVARQ
jgi:hypothetical protein